MRVGLVALAAVALAGCPSGGTATPPALAGDVAALEARLCPGWRALAPVVLVGDQLDPDLASREGIAAAVAVLQAACPPGGL